MDAWMQSHTLTSPVRACYLVIATVATTLGQCLRQICIASPITIISAAVTGFQEGIAGDLVGSQLPEWRCGCGVAMPW